MGGEGIAGVLIPAALGLIGLVLVAIVWKFLSGSKANAEALARGKANLERRVAAAAPSTATVESSNPTPSEMLDQEGFKAYRIVSIRMKVVPPGGGDAYEATDVWDVQVTALTHVAPGASVEVLVDREDPQRIYPKAPWGRPTTGLSKDLRAGLLSRA